MEVSAVGACGRPTVASSSASVFRHLSPTRGPWPSHPTSGPHPWLSAGLNPATNWEQALANCLWTKGMCSYKLSYGSETSEVSSCCLGKVPRTLHDITHGVPHRHTGQLRFWPAHPPICPRPARGRAHHSAIKGGQREATTKSHHQLGGRGLRHRARPGGEGG